MDEDTRRYRVAELRDVEPVHDDDTLRLKVHATYKDAGYGAATKWLIITREELEDIRDVLTGPDDALRDDRTPFASPDDAAAWLVAMARRGEHEWSGEWEARAQEAVAMLRTPPTYVGIMRDDADDLRVFVHGDQAAEYAALWPYTDELTLAPLDRDAAATLIAESAGEAEEARHVAKYGKTYDHEPTGGEEPDTCGVCGEATTWIGPTPYDVMHVDDKDNR